MIDVPLCFIDTETTGLEPRHRPWEIAVIRREPDGTQQTGVMVISDIDLSGADSYALNVGRLFERHPRFAGERVKGQSYVTESTAAGRLFRLLWGAHLVGVGVHFDAGMLAAMLRRHGLTPGWHYHLIDVAQISFGYAAGQYAARNRVAAYTDHSQLPWSSDALAADLGVEPPGDDERHTALGDARWAMRWWDKLTGAGDA